jgi:hypothetical protein
MKEPESLLLVCLMDGRTLRQCRHSLFFECEFCQYDRIIEGEVQSLMNRLGLCFVPAKAEVQWSEYRGQHGSVE